MKSTTVGLYPRPEYLQPAIRHFAKGRISAEQLEQEYRKAAKNYIELQEKAGIDYITSGGFSWDDVITPYAANTFGFKLGGLIRFFDNNNYYRKPSLTVGLIAREWKVADEMKKKAELKAIVPGPFTLAKMSEIAPFTTEEFVAIAGQVLNAEVKALYAAGCRNFQIDEPSLVFEKNIPDEEVDAASIAFAELRKGIDSQFCLQTYFGGAGEVYEKLLDFPADLIGLDFASVASGKENFDLVKEHGTGGKKLVAGVIDARNTKMETEADVKKAIEKIRSGMKDGAVILAPNAALEYLPEVIAEKKVKFLGEVARKL
ncbi:Methionine synthase [Candidatus Gugararchaeum adminiculabundum]|nr:Methionine synthase [Candidatus Gugararchaeum adminiculabundum]